MEFEKKIFGLIKMKSVYVKCIWFIIVFVTLYCGCAGPIQNNDITVGIDSFEELEYDDELILSSSFHTGPACYNDADDELVSTNYQQKVATVKKTDVCVYVENSGSMYGYVGTGVGSDFRNTVYDYLTNIKLSYVFDCMHLHFVNSQVMTLKPDVKDFVDKLTPNSFRVVGGNSGSTDIAEIIKRIYPSNGRTALLVSDCIVSPGRGKNASEYLANQQAGLKVFMGEQKGLRNTGVIIYRMLGHFKGYYYNTVDYKKQYDGIRPYYIWVMGDIRHLKKMREITESKMKTPPDEICVISMGDSNIKYNIVPAGGKYKISHTDRFTIEKLKKVKTTYGERAVVKLNADFSKMLQDDTYLTDVSNYEVSDKMYSVDNVIKTNSNQYVITISSPIVKKGSIYVRLKNKPPQWVNSCSDTDGGFPNPNAKLQTTYGLSYLIGGVYDAYTFNGDNLAEMKITIK